MAKIIPESVFSDEHITVGERKSLHALRMGLDDSTIVWYQPRIKEERRADIIAYIPQIGVVLYEVKDWTIGNIIKADPDFWEVQFSRSERKVVTAPYKQARNYYHNLNKQLEKVTILLSREGDYKGRVKLPIAAAVVFPNIKKQDFLDASYDSVLDVKKCLFQDDIKFIQESDKPRQVIQRIRQHFTEWWGHDELTEEELNKLRGILYPEIKSTQKDKGGTKKEIILDIHQEEVVKKIGSGHSIVRGVAGSGKSLVLCSKALFLAEENPEWKILITCFNAALASQLRYYIESFRKRENANVGNIEVTHFHKLLVSIFRKHGVNYPQINREEVLKGASIASSAEHQQAAKLDEMESALIGHELERICLTKKTEKFQAILVDESQDFHTSWLRGLVLLLDGETNFLLLAEDPSQKIYSRSFTYKGADIRVQGKKPHRLPIGHRSTPEIIIPASKLVENCNWDKFYKEYIKTEGDVSVDEKANFHEDRANFPAGQYPKVLIIKNYSDICLRIADDISDKLKNGYNYSDFGIIYLVQKTTAKERQKSLDLEGSVDYVQGIRAELSAKQIPHYWLTQNRDTKRSYDQFREEVTLTTIFSAKGLEFEVVYLVGLELYPWPKRNERENASMLYVAMTRAKSELLMFSTENTPYVEKIQTSIEEAKGTTP